jgi:hypothetical protein
MAALTDGQKAVNKEWTGDENDQRGFQFQGLFYGTPMLSKTNPFVVILKDTKNYVDGQDYFSEFIYKSAKHLTPLAATNKKYQDMLNQVNPINVDAKGDVVLKPVTVLTNGFPLKADALVKIANIESKDDTESTYFDNIDVFANGMFKKDDEIPTTKAYFAGNDAILGEKDLKVDILPLKKLFEILEENEFKIISTIDANGKVIKRFESFEDWVKSPKPYTIEVLNNLKKISNFVNYHPEALKLLNEPAPATKPVADGVDPKFAGKIMLLPPMDSNNDAVVLDFKDAVKKQQKILFGEYLHNAMAQNTVKQLPNVWFPYHLKGGVQQGGDISNIGKIYKTIKTQLKHKGITIAPKDDELITNKIDGMNEYLSSMKKLQADLGTYSHIAGVFENTPNGDLTLGMVQKAVEKFKVCLAKYGRHEGALIDVMKQICNKM